MHLRVRTLLATGGTVALAAAGLAAPPASAAPPSNDDFANAQVIPADGVYSTDNTEATYEPGEPQPSCAFSDQGPGPYSESSVWFELVAPATTHVTLHTRGSGALDTQIAVYSGPAVDSLVEVACNEDIDPTVNDFQSELVLPVQAGTHYMVQVATWADGAGAHTQGPIDLTVSGGGSGPVPPANDHFADAAGVTSYGTEFVDTTSATVQEGEPLPSCAYAEEGPGPYSEGTVWYAFTAPETEDVRIHTRGSTPDTQLAVYTGESLGTLMEAACNEDIAFPSNLQSEIVLSATAGSTYLVQLATWTDGEDLSSRGPIDLTFTDQAPPPPGPENDVIDAAVEVLPGTASGSNVLATDDPTDGFVNDLTGCANAKTIWYYYVPAEPGTAEVDLSMSTFDTTLGYLEIDPETFEPTEGGCDEDSGVGNRSRLQFDVTPGHFYYFQVGSAAGEEGDVALELAGPGSGGGPGDVQVTGVAKKASGTQISFKVDVGTDGTGQAPDGTLTLDPPAGFKVTSVDAATPCGPGDLIVCPVPPLSSSETFSVTVTGTPRSEGPFVLDALWEAFVAPMRGQRSVPLGSARSATTRPAFRVDDPSNNDAQVTASRSVVCDNKPTAKANTAKGTGQGDILCGLGGGDTLKGLDGNDLIFGGDAADTLLGGAGNDKVYGGAGGDSLVGGGGKDTLDGGGGKDRCRESADTQTSCET